MKECKLCNQPEREGITINENGYCSICTQLYPEYETKPQQTQEKPKAKYCEICGMKLHEGICYNCKAKEQKANQKKKLKRIPRPTPFNANKTVTDYKKLKIIALITALGSSAISAVILMQFLIDHYDIQAWIFILLIYTSIISTYTFTRQ